jgi:hypothetical protein
VTTFGDARATRFGDLLAAIELEALALNVGDEPDLLVGLTRIRMALDEAVDIAFEVSREALDRVVDDTGNGQT